MEALSFQDVLATTDGAVLLDVDGQEVWVPRSLIDGEGDELERRQGPGEIEVQKWFLEREGLI